jgi:hypothetical protein
MCLHLVAGLDRPSDNASYQNLSSRDYFVRPNLEGCGDRVDRQSRLRDRLPFSIVHNFKHQSMNQIDDRNTPQELPESMEHRRRYHHDSQGRVMVESLNFPGYQ